MRGYLKLNGDPCYSIVRGSSHFPGQMSRNFLLAARTVSD